MKPFTTLLERFGFRSLPNPMVVDKQPVKRALHWIKANGIPRDSHPPYYKVKSSPTEVVGGLISTLYHWGEKAVAFDVARWEASLQQSDGAFLSPNPRVPPIFNTAHAMRGFLIVVNDLPEIGKNLRQACDYVEKCIASNGNVRFPSPDGRKDGKDARLPDYYNLSVLPPLSQAGALLAEPKYQAAAQRGLLYYRHEQEVLEFPSPVLSPYFGYLIEALVELGELELAIRGLNHAAAVQRAEAAGGKRDARITLRVQRIRYQISIVLGQVRPSSKLPAGSARFQILLHIDHEPQNRCAEGELPGEVECPDPPKPAGDVSRQEVGGLQSCCFVAADVIQTLPNDSIRFHGLFLSRLCPASTRM